MILNSVCWPAKHDTLQSSRMMETTLALLIIFVKSWNISRVFFIVFQLIFSHWFQNKNKSKSRFFLLNHLMKLKIKTILVWSLYRVVWSSSVENCNGSSNDADAKHVFLELFTSALWDDDECLDSPCIVNRSTYQMKSSSRRCDISSDASRIHRSEA